MGFGTGRQRALWVVLATTAACASEDRGTAAEDATDGALTMTPTTTDAGETTETEGEADTGMKLDALGGSGDDADGSGETGMQCEQDVDIVFVMDVSTTMGPFLDTLAAEIDVVDAALQALDTPNPPRYGLAVFVDDARIVNAGQPYDDVAALKADFEMWGAFTAGNGQVNGGGFNSTWPENSLDALWMAASVFQWRPAESTLRLVIHTTDDTFWDGPTTVDAIEVQHGYAETVAALQANEVRVFTFADLIGGSCECEDVSMGWSTPYMGMDPIPDQTGGGWWNINEVLAAQISLAASIDQAVDETICTPYPPTE